jgi:integrase
MVHKLDIYRRHARNCPNKSDAKYLACGCPLQVFGRLPNGKLVQRTSLGTNDMDVARQTVWTWQQYPDNLSLATASLLDTQRMVQKLARLHAAPQPEAAVGVGATVGEAVGRFLRSRKGDGKRPATLRSHAKNLGYLPQTMPLASLDKAALETHRDERLVAGIEQSSWRTELASIRALCAWAVESDLITKNPAKLVKKPPAKTLPTRSFTDDEVAALIAACQTPFQRAIILTLLWTGLRVSDVALLKRDALEPDGRIVLRVMKTGKPIKLPLHSAAIAALRALPVDSAWWFWNGRSQPATAIHNVSMAVTRVGEQAGIAATPHQFRDTFAVSMLTAGVDVRTVQLALGHSSVAVTEKHYAHFIAAHQARLDDAVMARWRTAPEAAPEAPRA